MNTYITLLRGINIAGQKKILMKDLKDMFEKLGFTDVSTYIQSGNVIFSSPETDTSKLTQIIKTQIQETFGFDVPTLVITPECIKNVLENNPLVEEKMYITFLFEIPGEIDFEKIEAKKKSSENIHIEKNIIYFSCPEGYDRTKLSNNFFEKIFGCWATTRNLNTSKKLLALTS